jgi:hypothetical protein
MQARRAEIPGQARRAVIRLAEIKLGKDLSRDIRSNSLLHGRERHVAGATTVWSSY